MRKRIFAVAACVVILVMSIIQTAAMTLNVITDNASYNGMLYDKAQFTTNSNYENESIISIDLPQTIPPLAFTNDEYRTINDTYLTTQNGGVGSHSLFNTLYVTRGEDTETYSNTLLDTYDAQQQFRINDTTSYVINDRRFIEIVLQSTSSKAIHRLMNYSAPKIYVFANSEIDIRVNTTVNYEHMYYDTDDNGNRKLIIDHKIKEYNTTRTFNNVVSAELYGDIANDTNTDSQDVRMISDIYTTINISYDNNDYNFENDLMMFTYKYINTYQLTSEEYWNAYFPNGIDTDDTIQSEIRLGQFLSKTLNGFFQTQLFGTFSIGDILIACIGIGVLFAVLKYFAGG